MGCGCGAPKARRNVRNMVKSPSGVLKAVASTNHGMAQGDDSQAISEERRKIEKLRRDAILRALGRP